MFNKYPSKMAQHTSDFNAKHVNSGFLVRVINR